MLWHIARETAYSAAKRSKLIIPAAVLHGKASLCYHTRMERLSPPKKHYHSASYLTSAAVFYGTILFLVARIFTLLQLFSDAYTRKQLDQAPPERFTFFGIVGYLLVIGILGAALYLLWQSKKKKLRMKAGNLYLLLNVLFAAWGIVSAISYFFEMILFFEFVYLLDFLTLIAALVLPSILYQLSDRRQDIPPDGLLFVSSIGATALSAIALIIVALVLRKSYTAFQLLRELMFRAGIILFGVAGLLKAIRLRAELPALVAAMPKVAPKPAAPKPEPKKKVDSKGRVRCPDCGKKLPDGTQICPRCGYDIETPDLFGDDDDEYEDSYDDAPAPPAQEEAWSGEAEDEPPQESDFMRPVRQELPKDICPRCQKKKPPFLSTCPHCGYYPGDPIEQAELEAERENQARASASATGQPAGAYVPPLPKDEPKCEKCGKKLPGGLTTCPYCGYHPNDAHVQKEPPKQQVDKLFEDEEAPEIIYCPLCDNEVVAGTEVCPHCEYVFADARYTGRLRTQQLPRIPEPRRLTEKNSIECPECGRRYFAARDVCPYCGFGLYDD